MIRWFIRPSHLFVLLLSLLLVACAEDEAGPQFATGPRPTQISTPILPSTRPTAIATPRAAATPSSIVDLLNARATAQRVFAAAGNTIWSVTSRGKAQRLYEVRSPATLIAIAPNPGADRVAALVESNAKDSPRYEVLILDDVGQVASRLEGNDLTPATPPPEEEGLASIDWSPQGDHILVAFRNGEILVASPGSDEPPMFLDALGNAAQIIEAAWSPTGESIAFIAIDNERIRSLRSITLNGEQAEVIVSPANDRMPIDFAWMPDGVSLLFTEGGQPGGPNSGIDLWRVNADGANRQLVASAGTVAPVARIAEPRPSPDGRSVAYAVLVPGEAGPEVDSVWVRDLTSNVGFRVEIPPVAAVDDFYWTDAGLLVATEAVSTANQTIAPELLRVNPDATAEVIWEAPVTVSTPVAATPIASPVRS